MSLLTYLSNFFNSGETPDTAPEGYCPNCWGRTEYGGKFFEAIKNENVDANSLSEKKGWIQDYADKHLNDIHTQQTEEGYVCGKCKVKYRSA